MSNNQSIIDFNKYIEILLLKHLFNMGNINKASYDKVREYYRCKEEVA